MKKALRFFVKYVIIHYSQTHFYGGHPYETQSNR